MTHDQIVTRLEQIEEALAKLDQEQDHPAGAYYKAKRDFELEWAKTYITKEGTVEERKNRTILALYQSDAYKDLVLAEAAYEGWKARYRLLETRASIGQSLLKASTREGAFA